MKTIWLVGGYGTKSREWYLATLKGNLQELGYDVRIHKYCDHNQDINHLARSFAYEVAQNYTGENTFAVGHSMGGLVVANSGAMLDGFVTICSPHGGTQWARCNPLSDSCRQMVPGSALTRRQKPPASPALALGGRFDGIVSATSARLYGAVNELINHDHVTPIFSRKIASRIVKFFDRHVMA